jgi:amidase
VALLLGGCTNAPTASPGSSEAASVGTGTTSGPTLAVPSQPVASAARFPMEATIPELQAAMERGDLSAVQLVDFYLARIAAYDDAGPKLNAFIVINPKARDEAEALDAERQASGPRGPLHGIPVVIKDNIDTADLPTTAGTLPLAGFVPTDDAFQVRKLRGAGAIILGKTNMFEFAQGWETASSLGGQTLSPYDVRHDPGGSSGGSAVAVTANFAVVGFGTDTCGSVRYPAVLNDLYGLRPTEGLSSRSGVIPLSSTLDAVGPMARSVVDLAIVLDATAGVDPADPVTVAVDASYASAVDSNGLAGRRVGIVSYSLHPEVELLMAAAIRDLQANGVEVVKVDLPAADDMGRPFDEFDTAINAYLAAHPGAPVHSMAELSAFFKDHRDLDHAGLANFDGVISLDTDAYRASIAGRPVFRDAVVAQLNALDLDAIVSPESANAAPLLDNNDQHPWDCSSAPYGGLPALSVPIGFTANGLPVGLELMGRPFAETTLIAMASGYEAHTSHRFPPPTTPDLR